MAFVYCPKCDWQQDDFWSWHYNPIRYFVTQMLPWLWRPRQIQGDAPACPVFSWWLLAKEFWRAVNPLRYYRQRWWTYAGYLRSKARSDWPDGAMCPKCYHFGLSID